MNLRALKKTFALSGSVRTKVWACVIIALAGYFVATLSGFYSNYRQAKRLSHLQNIHFPLARLADEALNTYKSQISKYEDAFLAGEPEQAVLGNRLSADVLHLLDQMEEVRSRAEDFDNEKEMLSNLRRQYLEFSQLAAEAYLRTQSIEISVELQKKVQQLGSMQTRLLNDMQTLSQHLTIGVEEALQEEMRLARINTIFLGILFVLVLASSVLVSRWFANQQLIHPLARLQEMVNLFAQNKELPPLAVASSSDDEIHNLAASFWSMTKQLKETMVSKEYMDNIIQHLTGCLMVLSPSLTVVKVNYNTTHLLGYNAEELEEKRVSELICEESRLLFEHNILQSLLNGHPVINREICLRTKENVTIPVLFSGSVLYTPNQELEALICVANDIRERKKTEEILRKIEVERALCKTKSLADIGQLTSSIAHEMRNPLSSIKLNIKAVKQKLQDENPAFAELAEIAWQQSLRLESMLNDLLNYGRPLTLNLVPTTLEQLLNAALTDCAEEKRKKAVNIECTNSLGEIPLRIDPELFTRAIANLLANAIQWSPVNETVFISGRLHRDEHGQEQAVIQIRDNGPGINKEKIGRLFQPFFTTRPGGTGLGLAIVRKIIEYHGATISGGNRPEGGTEFTIVLPLRQVS